MNLIENANNLTKPSPLNKGFLNCVQTIEKEKTVPFPVFSLNSSQSVNSILVYPVCQP